MTEQEWLECWLHEPMLNHLGRNSSKRKLRLMAAAYGKTQLSGMVDNRSSRALELLELFADGLANKTEMTLAVQAAINATLRFEVSPFNEEFLNQSGSGLGWIELGEIHEGISRAVQSYRDEDVFECATSATVWLGEYIHPDSCFYIREIFGNPFRPVIFDTRWLTSNVVGLANAIYWERAFDRMPILADALMDAGCDSGLMLDHCHSEKAHCRGCWVVDLLLGKS